MDFKVIWSDEAITDLRGICSYIARDNPEAALRMGNRSRAQPFFDSGIAGKLAPRN